MTPFETLTRLDQLARMRFTSRQPIESTMLIELSLNNGNELRGEVPLPMSWNDLGNALEGMLENAENMS